MSDYPLGTVLYAAFLTPEIEGRSSNPGKVINNFDVDELSGIWLSPAIVYTSSSRLRVVPRHVLAGRRKHYADFRITSQVIPHEDYDDTDFLNLLFSPDIVSLWVRVS